MKKIIVIAAFALINLPFGVSAQKEKQEVIEIEEKIETKEAREKGEKKETQEIVIRNKGGKDLNLKVEINGEKITVNGKPLDQFIDNDVTINKRKIIVRDGNKMMEFNFDHGGMNFNEDFVKQWKHGEEVTKPFLGVTTEKADGGAKITEISKESAAEKVGLKKDDIITKVDDKVIKDGESLSEAIGSKKPKDIVLVNYLRNGKPAKVKVTLGERKIKAPMALAYGAPRAKVRSFSLPKKSPGGHDMDMIYEEGIPGMDSFAPGAGFDVTPFIGMENMYSRQKKLGLKIQDTEEGGNVKVIEVEEGSAAEKAGLKKDDVITEIGGVTIENTDDARKQLQPSEKKSAYTIKVKRGGKEMNLEVKFPKQLKTANL